MTNITAQLATLLEKEAQRLRVPATFEARENGTTARLSEPGLPLPIYCMRTTPSSIDLLGAWRKLPDGASEQAQSILQGAP